MNQTVNPGQRDHPEVRKIPPTLTAVPLFLNPVPGWRGSRNPFAIERIVRSGSFRSELSALLRTGYGCRASRVRG